MISLVVNLAFLFFFSFTSLFFLRKIAKHVGLVDKPNYRKLHDGSIPLVGGISICISMTYFLINNPQTLPNVYTFISCILMLVLVGALDDRFDISYKFRFFVQAIVSVFMMKTGGVELHTLGDIFGLGEITLGSMGYIVTVIAVIGAINAFNMVDGIDGLLGALSIVTFSSLGFLVAYDGQKNIAYSCLVMIVITIPYILLNLGAFGKKRKVFMGDAGSMLIGFTIIWFLLLSSQNGKTPPLRPVTALWLIALPLMDMSSIMIRRIRRGDSPFKPDRDHLHHIFQKYGLSSNKTLCIISFISFSCAAFGIIGEIYSIEENIMFYGFIATFIVYSTILNCSSIINAKVKRLLSSKNRI